MDPTDEACSEEEVGEALHSILSPLRLVQNDTTECKEAALTLALLHWVFSAKPEPVRRLPD